MTGKWIGLPIFLIVMALVFFLTFTVGDWLKGYFEIGLEIVTEKVSGILCLWGINPMLESLIVGGVLDYLAEHFFQCCLGLDVRFRRLWRLVH